MNHLDWYALAYCPDNRWIRSASKNMRTTVDTIIVLGKSCSIDGINLLASLDLPQRQYFVKSQSQFILITAVVKAMLGPKEGVKSLPHLRSMPLSSGDPDSTHHSYFWMDRIGVCIFGEIVFWLTVNSRYHSHIVCRRFHVPRPELDQGSLLPASKRWLTCSSPSSVNSINWPFKTVIFPSSDLGIVLSLKELLACILGQIGIRL